MKIHRFIGEFELDSKEVVIQDVELVRQILRVLKLQKGEEVILSDGRGSERLGEIKDLGIGRIVVVFKKKIQKTKESVAGVVLYQAILKKENFELVVQKATEVGVSRIVPMFTERVVKQGLNETRMKKIIKEASEQSGRSTVPELSAAISFEDALKNIPGNETKWFFDIGGKDLSLPSQSKKQTGKIHIFVGPEGGWTPKEKAEALKRGCSMVSMGRFTLRGETAAIVASYLATNQ